MNLLHNIQLVNKNKILDNILDNILENTQHGNHPQVWQSVTKM